MPVRKYRRCSKLKPSTGHDTGRTQKATLLAMGSKPWSICDAGPPWEAFKVTPSSRPPRSQRLVMRLQGRKRHCMVLGLRVRPCVQACGFARRGL
ncbi:unnamed protein product [Symbiodinium sp. CCMP2592]|nr:unnamed protein product [Symbiodinium sp. CCMP2592]